MSDMTPPARRGLRRWLITLSLLFNLAILTILFTPLTEWLYYPLSVSETPRPSNVIVILSWGAYDTNGGVPDFNTLTRLRKGLELYRQGLAPEIICVGANRLPLANKSYAELMRETLLSYGVPPEVVHIFDQIPGDWNYYDNLLAMVNQYKDRLDFNKAIIITSTGNSLRIKKSFLKKGYNPTLVSSGDFQFKPYNWHNRFEFFRDIANEYYAMALFYALGRI